ncbi:MULTISPECIES: methyltransferase domain-containing protein [Methylomonas]|uniref:methyltransferase domain-containing protein n=1 Tax=Methylomonas TaxID=416 RepID=UPI001232BAE2|nr:methyltransferase domain-containing protein [Methylomonas rhizoryzae]
MLSSRLAEYAADFCCPHCQTYPLQASAATLVCSGCGAQYPVQNGIPILLTGSSAQNHAGELSTEHGLAMVAEYEHSKPTRATLLQRVYRFLRPPEMMLHFNPDLRRTPDTRALFDYQGEATRILNVGGGPHRYSDREITLNLAAFHNVDCVGDAHHIPFRDNCFDSVICNAVLEHVYQPEWVVAEMLRVLKPNGRLYAELPFIFFFHGYPNDFHRFTLEGMKKLFAGLEQPQFGITLGPVSAILQSANILCGMLIPDNYPKLRKLVNGAFRWLFFPWKYLDKLMRNHPDAHKLAGGFYVLGRKKA